MNSDKPANIRVLVRIRPLNERELMNCGSIGRTSVLSVLPGNKIAIANSTSDFNNNNNNAMNSSILMDQSFHHMAQGSSSNKKFEFDAVLGSDSTQENVYGHVQSIVDACLQGYNGTIVAYGQTGSGKTHTVFGEDSGDEMGLVHRSLNEIFEGIAKVKAEEGEEDELFGETNRRIITTKASFIEIFNEKVYDLLCNDSMDTALQVREDTDNKVFVEGLTEKEVHSVSEVQRVLTQGMEHRRVASTAMNRASSRSHAVFSLTIKSEDISSNGQLSKVRTSKFTLVDLAGSERQKATKADGERLKEASMINKSLLTLGHVINTLVEREKGKDRHIHYRDSKLTYLLRDSWGGNSKTCLVATVSPSGVQMGETLSTLKFAQRAKLIKNTAIVNEDTSGTIAALRAEVSRLKRMVTDSNTNSYWRRNGEGPSRSPKFRKVICQQKTVITSLKRKLKEEVMQKKFKVARIEHLKQNKSQNEDVNLLLQEIDNLERTIEAPSADAVAWKIECENLRGQQYDSIPDLWPTPEIADRLVELEEKLSILQSENLEMKNKITNLKSASAQSLAEAAEAGEEIERLDFEIESLTSQLKEEKLEREKAQDFQRTQESDKLFLEKEIEHLEEEKKEMRLKLEKVEASSEELLGEVDRLMDELEKVQQKVNAAETEKRTFEMRMEEEINQLRKRLEESAAISAGQLQLEKSLREEIMSLSKDKTALEHKTEVQRSENESIMKNAEQLQAELTETKASSMKKLEEIENERSSARELLSEVNALKDQLEISQQKTTTVEKQKLDSETRMKKETDQLRKRLEDSATVSADQLQLEKSLREEIMSLSKEKTSLEQTLSDYANSSDVAMKKAQEVLEQVNEMRAEILKKDEELKAEKASNKEILLQVNRLEADLEKSGQRAKSVEAEKLSIQNLMGKEVNHLRSRLEESASSSAKHLELEKSLRGEVLSLSKDKAALEQKLAANLKENTNLLKKNEDLQKEIKETKKRNLTKIEELEARNGTLLKEARTIALDERRESESKVSELYLQLRARENENNELEEKVTQKENAIKAVDLTLKEMRVALKVVTRERDEKEFESDSLREDIDTLREQIRFLTKHCEEIQDENNELRSALGIDDSFGSTNDPNKSTMSYSNENDNVSSLPKSILSPLPPSSALKVSSKNLFSSKRMSKTPISCKKTTKKPLSTKKSVSTGNSTPLSDATSRFQNTFQSARKCPSTMKKRPPVLEESFDETMFFPPDMEPPIADEKENTPMKSVSMSSKKIHSTTPFSPFRSIKKTVTTPLSAFQSTQKAWERGDYYR